ncbi:MAG: hypothetical protein EBY39_11650, partial [Flavobacteriia bacterium]|nr:hypothetical protein [Flavobacteriia bacterium]
MQISKEVEMETFVEKLNKAWKTADVDFNTTYFDITADIFVLDPGETPAPTSADPNAVGPPSPVSATISAANQKKFIDEVLFKGDSSYEKLVNAVSSSINGVIGARRKTQNSLVKQLIGGLGEVDPFYDKDWLKQYYLYSQDQYDNTNINRGRITDNFLPIYGIRPYGSKTRKVGETSVVSFGSIVVAIITSHLACIGKFDEIQIVSYTANSYCGLMSNRNIMSFLIDRKELTDFLFQLFSKEAKYTIEAIMTQICQRFISTRDQICYGIKSLYTRDGDKSIRPKNQNVKQHQKDVNDALQRIYEARSNSDNTSDSLKRVVFLMPKIKFSFDTLTTKESGYLKTISRISIFDQQDNPFGSVKEIMEKVYDENIILAAAEINRLRAEMFSKKDKKVASAGKRNSTIDAFYDKSNKIVQDLIDKEIIVREGNSFRVAGSFKTNSLKQEFKRIMPSATYGTQNNTLLDASISTINEANLNTVYLTRPDRNSPDSLAKISFGNDLPLRILPAQADITIYGCPFVNFAQYIFLDFETGTTVDNTYAVTGIKHDMSPGKFTTSLTLSYGDVYGKYENAVSTIKKIMKEDTQKSSVRFFGGNIRLEGIDDTKLPSDLVDIGSLTLDKDLFTFDNDSKLLENVADKDQYIQDMSTAYKNV